METILIALAPNDKFVAVGKKSDFKQLSSK